ncbi:MAG: D-serine ammonia-lyase [Desulfosporosinus sp.]|nr:D-serine ammonia-lyase [Desulfosporosinus sp.]MBC2728531.1 D-serine ammonia-lyase [Desulfosporosinus sp.]
MLIDHNYIAGRTLKEWKLKHPLIDDLISAQEAFWINPEYKTSNNPIPIEEKEIHEAETRLIRFAPYIAQAFPETQHTGGLIESPLMPIQNMQGYISKRYNIEIPGHLWLKCDSHLPISGSIKARGGIYKVLKHAETLALTHGLLKLEDDYAILNSPKYREFFSHYSLAVGSTGNLGLSIGVIGAKLGFQVTVHMSADAKAWKKELLRSKGVQVFEYTSDYSKAVEEGRRQAENDPRCHFVDDENSRDLFLGYAVAAYRLKEQLDKLKIAVDSDHPLFVYLPCGVGGGPGGVTYGLKQVFKENVHCFFAEPTHSPCMLLGLATGLHDQISVQDIGLDNRTEADGLAVGRASRFVGKTIETFLSGVYTIKDEELFILLQALKKTENLQLEPSALAGMPGSARVSKTQSGREYLKQFDLVKKMSQANHIVWATGGSLVPKEIMDQYLNQRD